MNVIYIQILEEGGRCSSGYDDYTEIDLTAGEILYLISKKIDDKGDLFKGLDMSEVDVDATMEDMAFEAAFPDQYEVDDYSDYVWGGNCEQLDIYLESWKTLIGKILTGEVDEDSLDNWLEYFDDSDNYSEGGDDIESWYDYQDFDEDDGIIHRDNGDEFDDEDETLELCRNCDYYDGFECSRTNKGVGEYDSCDEFVGCGY